MAERLRLGIDLGGTKVKMALVDRRGKIAAAQRLDTVGDPRGLAAALGAAYKPWREKKCAGTGVGVAGDVDPTRGVVRFAPNLGWKNVPLKNLLARAGFPAPLYVDNDATAAAWGAYHVEFAKRPRHVVVLTLGTGVGGGMIFDGKLYRGATGSAGELGHIVVEMEGAPCACGNRGCLEAYLGGRAITAWASAEFAKAGRPQGDLDPKALEKLALSGDTIAQAAWARAGKALGVALANLANALNPEVILLAGGVANGSRMFLPIALHEMKSRGFETPVKALKVRLAKHGADLGVIGAALLVP